MLCCVHKRRAFAKHSLLLRGTLGRTRLSHCTQRATVHTPSDQSQGGGWQGDAIPAKVRCLYQYRLTGTCQVNFIQLRGCAASALPLLCTDPRSLILELNPCYG